MLVKSSRFEDEIRKSAKKDPNNSFSQRYVTQHGITGVINAQNQITVAVGMFNVTARGAVINGVFHLGMAFLRDIALRGKGANSGVTLPTRLNIFTFLP